MAFDSEPDIKTVYRDRMIRLRDFLAVLPDEKFNMSRYSSVDFVEHTCRTPACIAGWTPVVFNERTLTQGEKNILDPYAVRDYLGLTTEQAVALFRSGMPVELYRWTTRDAVRVIDQFLATGVIDWDAARVAQKEVAHAL